MTRDTQTEQSSKILDYILDTSHATTLDILGPLIEFITSPGETDDFAVMKGTIPPGVVVPLHSHPDAECFFVLAGTQQVLTESAGRLEWHEVHAGDYVDVEPGTRHAWRNDTQEPVIDLIIATRRLGRFFEEIGRPIEGTATAPAPEDFARLVAVAGRYGYWLGSPEENAAVGIALPT
jgi:quercetin dioxygenase-like cupin family protein